MRSTEGSFFRSLAYFTPSSNVAVHQQRDHQALTDFGIARFDLQRLLVKLDRRLVVVIDIGRTGSEERAGESADRIRVEDHVLLASSVLAASSALTPPSAAERKDRCKRCARKKTDGKSLPH